MTSLPLIEKLVHPLADVRRRALRSLQFKLQHGLLDAASLTPDALADASQRLLCFLLQPTEPATNSVLHSGDAQALVALELLAVLARQPSAAAQMLQLGADQALIRVADELPGCSQRACALLGELLCSGTAPHGELSPLATCTGTADRACIPWGVSDEQLGYVSAADPEPSQWATPSLTWPATSPPAELGDAAATSCPFTPQPSTAPHALTAGGRCIKVTQLSEDDSQQLFEVALELQPERAEAAGDATLLATLATLRYGVLADMPAAAVAGEPSLLQALLRLVDGAQGRPRVAAAALGVLETLATALAAAELAAEGEAGLPLGPLAHKCLLRCAVLLCNSDLQPQALVTAQALLPLLDLQADEGMQGVASNQTSGCLALAPLLAALAEAFRMNLLSECTAAGVVPPDSFASGFYALVLGPSTLGIMDLIRGLVERRPRLLSAKVLPPLVCDLLVALAIHPVVAVSAQELHSWAVALLPSICPPAAAQVDAVAWLQEQRDQLEAASQQLASAPTAALAAACCRELQQLLPALELLSKQEHERAVALAMASAARHASCPAAASLAARLLLHHRPSVRHSALAALYEALGTAQHAAALVMLQPAVAGSLVFALGQELEHQQLAASILQATVVSDQSGCGHAFLPWELWLLCFASSPVVGPAVACILQAAARQKHTLFQNLHPVLLALFHSTPAVAAEAAHQLHTAVIQQRPAAAASMLFCPLPFDGLLAPAGPAVGQQESAAKAVAAAAARLFTAADVQSLLSVLASPSVQPDLAAAAFGQLAQVAGDPRFGVLLGRKPVLSMLLRHAQGGSSSHHTQQPALACLVTLAEQQPSVADWLLADADALCVPLLSLAFHPLPAVRQALAQLLDTLLFGTAARQLHSLAGQIADGSVNSSSFGAASMPQAGVPEPFCASYHFAHPTAVLPLSSALHPNPPCSIFTGEVQQRLWQAQQLCHTAVASIEGSKAGSLLQLLSRQIEAADRTRWEADFVRASLAMLHGLQPEGLVAEALRQLAASESHKQCHAALRRMELLIVALPEGMLTLAAAPWRDALNHLLSAAPLSPEECALWTDMLPLLQRLLGPPHPARQQPAALEQQLLLRLAQQFAGGSARSFAEQAGAEDRHAAALLPAVLRTVRLLVQHAGQRSSAAQREQLLEACRFQDWLDLIAQRLEVGQPGYAVRVAALQLATAVLEASRDCTRSASPLSLLVAVVRRVLMPRELWCTHHCHGKAAILAALQLLLVMTQVMPAADWAEAWAAVGSTFWLSRAAGDTSPAVRQAALRLLAAALAVPVLWNLLATAWPECGEAAVKAALDCTNPADVRAAALDVAAAALSHGLSNSASSDAAAACEAIEPAAKGQDGVEPLAVASPLALAPQPLPSCAAERLLQEGELWNGIKALMQQEEDPALLSAAAHAVLQRALLDAEGAALLPDWKVVLVRLLHQPAAVLTGIPGVAATAPPEQIAAAAGAFRAAHAAAALLAAFCHLAAADCWAHLSAAPGLLAAAASAFSWAASLGCCPLPDVVQPAAAALLHAAQAALEPLADAIALLAQASDSGSPDQLGAACGCSPLPLAAAVATAMCSLKPQPRQLSRPLRFACCRLLVVLLQKEAEAACFLRGSSGQEHQLPAASGAPEALQPVGAVLATCLMEQWLGAAAESNSGYGACADDQHRRQVLDVALGALLAFSTAAKQVAVDAGLHSSLLDSCRALAAGMTVPMAAAPLQPLPQLAAAARRSAKLHQLRGARRSSTKQTAAVLAFGSRAPASAPSASKPSGRRSSCWKQASSGSAAITSGPEPAGQPTDGVAVAGHTDIGPSEQGASPPVHAQRRQQQLIECLLALLHRLAHNSAAPSCCLVEAGAMDVAATLWGAGGPAVQASLLSLLATLLHNSAEARSACASTGEPPLLDRLVASVLSGSSPPVAALSAFAATPDGARVLVHSSGFAARALRALQDQLAAKEWRRMLPTLQVLTDLCSQPEGQRAVLCCSTPSDTMLDLLLSLTEHDTPTPAAAAAGAAALLLSQLALCPEAKAHFVSRRGALQALLDAVSAAGAQPERAAAAAHALWALVHGGERVKVAVRRCEGWERALGAALAACRQEEQPALRDGVEALQRLLARDH